jgi:probable O-glycosylation ligase (exosortase A-associated)
VILLMIPFVYMFMPQQWHDRMSTIGSYETDGSAQGRIVAWTFAYKLASARPLTGGGFESFNRTNYEMYAPGLVDPQGMVRHYPDVHSIYFEMLGEQGFIGLAIFLILGLLTWINCNQVIKSSKRIEEYKWASDLTSMIQVSLVGYATGGAFLGLAYFDLPYHLLVITVLVKRILQKEISGFSNEKISFARQFNRNNPRHGSEQQLAMKS